jgi:hypothetical protein
MALVFDTGALIAFERGDRRIAAHLQVARDRREIVRTSSGCVAQAWRGGGARQALLARLLRGVEEQALERDGSRRVGALLHETGLEDVVDGHLALLARDGDLVLTSDVDDLNRLLSASGCAAEVERC